ncbi:MAG: DNA adenine methylase [Deltaproteobacteria bacterium]|nr:DNA adenine methylase [Deltaproteobacteria bacterium]
MKYNDLDLKNWKELDINVDSLWLIGARDRTGKHSNIYHGNFIPQIPNQLIRRFTKKHETVLDVFIGSGTTLFECEKLSRNCIGFDINEDILNYVKKNMPYPTDESKYEIDNCDVTNEKQFEEKINLSLKKINKKNVQLLIMHPPYLDIVKFTDKKEDLSAISDLSLFIQKFLIVIKNSLKYLENNRYFAIIIGDVYKNREVIPLSFYLLDAIKKKFRVKLKGIIVKNIEGNRGKLGKFGIWKYRALTSDYYIFKHEYILVFKKDK